MRTGLLWLDDRPNLTFQAKLEHAAAYYAQKYGHRPDTCYVHPSCLPQDKDANGITVRPAPDILPNHFWLGRKRH